MVDSGMLWFDSKIIKGTEKVMDATNKEVAEMVMEDAKKILKKKAKTTTEKGLLDQFSIVKSKFAGGGYIVYSQGSRNWRPPYHACVLGYDTWVKTDKGNKEIGNIKAGDFVIGQDGLPHMVNYVNSFYATEKPDLIELEVEFMKTKNHKITVTDDHKILTFKDGVSYWLKAGEFKENDVVFTAIKKAHNQGVYTGKIKTCVNCEKEYQAQSGAGQGKKYCSFGCKQEHWSNGNNWHLGKKRSKETCKKISDKINALLEKHPEKHINNRLSEKGFQTSTEKKVEDWLLSIGLEYKKQFKIGNNFVDFAVPSINLLIEADGAYWHQNQEKDINRDKAILSNIPDATIIHIHFADKRFTPELEHNPVKNVFYIQCNDSMNSFINLDYFKKSKIIKATKLKYITNGGLGKKLYDLSVENVHSFIASGIVVSNSFLEMGTFKDQAKPYLRPANKMNKRPANKLFQDNLDKWADRS